MTTAPAVNTILTDLPETGPETPVDRKKPQREFAIIRFPGKVRKQDPDTISVGINGQKFRMQRNEFIPAPKTVIDVLRDAKEPVAEPDNTPEQSNAMRRRKVVTFTPRFSFELLGWINKRDYEALRKIAKKRSITEKEVYEIL